MPSYAASRGLGSLSPSLPPSLSLSLSPTHTPRELHCFCFEYELEHLPPPSLGPGGKIQHPHPPQHEHPHPPQHGSCSVNCVCSSCVPLFYGSVMVQCEQLLEKREKKGAVSRHDAIVHLSLENCEGLRGWSGSKRRPHTHSSSST
jgi:hypothetical protein